MSAEEDTATGSQVERLADVLRYQRAYLLIYERYMEAPVHPEFRNLLENLHQSTQESIERFSSTLRRMGESPIQTTLPEPLLAQGMDRRGAEGRLQFIVVGSQNTIQYIQSQLERDDPEPVRTLWGELLQVQRQHLESTRALLYQVQHPYD